MKFLVNSHLIKCNSMTSCTMCLWNWYCAAVSPSDRNSLTSKNTQMQNVHTSTQIQKYTLYLWTRRCATASPSDRNPLSSTTHNNQQFFSSVPDPECTPSYLLTDNPASPKAITIASYANSLRPF